MRRSMYMLFAVVTLMGCGRIGYDGPTDEGLIAYWSFDDTDLATDVMGINDMTCEGAECPMSGDGVVGGAGVFDGASSCGSVPTLEDWSSPSFTISAWAKSPGMNGPVVVHESGSGCPSPAMEINEGSLGLVQLNTSDDAHNEAWTTSTIADMAEWHQVAVRWDGTSQQVYLDGVCSCSVTPELGPLDQTEAFTIGCYPNAGTMFTGTLDEVRLYDRALDPDEIAGLYAVGGHTAPLPQDCPATCAATPP